MAKLGRHLVLIQEMRRFESGYPYHMRTWRNWHTPTVEDRSFPGSNPGVRTTLPVNSPGGDGVCKTPGNANKSTVGSSPTTGTNSHIRGVGQRSPTCFGSRHNAGSNPVTPTKHATVA